MPAVDGQSIEGSSAEEIDLGSYLERDEYVGRYLPASLEVRWPSLEDDVRSLLVCGFPNE